MTLPKALCKLGFVPLLCASRGKAECATSIDQFMSINGQGEPQ